MSSLQSLAAAAALAVSGCALLQPSPTASGKAEAPVAMDARGRCLAVLGRVDQKTEEMRNHLAFCLQDPTKCASQYDYDGDEWRRKTDCDRTVNEGKRPHDLAPEVSLECDDPDVAGDTALQTQRKAALARAAHVAGQRLRYDLEKRGCPPLPDQSDASAKQ